MAVGFDAIIGGHAGSATTLSWTHTTGAGATLLVVDVGLAAGTTVSSVTYGAANLTALASVALQTGATASDRRNELWYLINPAAGATTITVTVGAAVNLCASSATFTGSDTTTPFGTPSTASGNGTTMNIPSVSSSSSGMVISGLSVRSTTAPTAPSNLALDQQVLFNVYESLAVIAGAASVSPSWSMTTADVWAGMATPINPAGAGGTNYSKTAADSLGATDTIPLLPPDGLTVTPISATELDVSWYKAAGATGYDLERDGSVISTNQPGATFADTGLTASTTYTYNVRSVRETSG